MNTLRNSELVGFFEGLTSQRQPWETPRIEAASLTLSTHKAPGTSESGTAVAGIKNGS